MRTIGAQATRQEALKPRRGVVAPRHARCPSAATCLEEAAEDVLASMAFPPEHGRQLPSTGPLERWNGELARRLEGLGIFPNGAAALRLAGAVLLEQQGEGAAAPRRSCSQTSKWKPLDAAAWTAQEVGAKGRSNLPGDGIFHVC
ncbi:MAG: transposase [Firmicutes bacterium]|nr:transposase [Bacillota bacterium]